MKTIKIDIPKGKEAHDIIATPHGCYIEVTYNLKDSWKPKDGEFVSYIAKNLRCLLIYKKKIGPHTEGYAMYTPFSKGVYIDGILHHISSTILPATEDEKQILLDALHKNGKDWDAENKKIVPYRWKPNEGDDYYYISDYGMEVVKYMWNNNTLDEKLYNSHNCFRTKNEAIEMLIRIKKVLNGAGLKGE